MSSEEKKSQKPVYVYLIILFVVALLLMAFSLVMSQRTNQQTLTELQNSSSSLRNYIEQVEALEDQIEALETDLDELRKSGDEEKSARIAADYLYVLEYQYREGDEDNCRKTLLAMAPYASFLRDSGGAEPDVPTPAERYETIRAALSEK